MASAAGRGAQVRLDGDDQAAARGALASTLNGNSEAKRVLEFTGLAADGLRPDGSTVTGLPAEDEILGSGGLVGGAAVGFMPAGVGAVASDIQSELRTTARPENFGAVGDGIADDTAAIQRWLDFGNAFGVHLTAYRPATYRISNTTLGTNGLPSIRVVLTRDISVSCGRNVVFKNDATVTGPTMQFRYDEGRDTFGLEWRGGVFDNSLGVYVTAAQSNTCFDMLRLYRVLIDGVRFIGGADIDTVTGNSDSGLTFPDCKKVTITNCLFEGQADAGVYNGGGPTVSDSPPDLGSDDGGEHLIVNNHFIRCWQGITVKRAGPRTIITGNTFTDIRVGVSELETGGVAPGRALIIANNHFKRINSRAIEVRQFGETKILGNTIEDWGYLNSDGTTIDPTAPAAIRIYGSSNTEIAHNSIKLRDWTRHVNHRGVYLTVATINSVVYTPAGNRIHDNDFDNTYIGIEENVAVGANSYINNTFGSGVNTRHSLTNAGSYAEWFQPTLNAKQYMFGSTEVFRVRNGSVSSDLLRTNVNAVGILAMFHANPSLDFGTITAGNRATLTVAVTGVLVGDLGIVNAPAGDRLPNGIVYQVRCKADAIDVEARNYSNGSITIPAASFSVAAIRLS